LLSYRRNVPNDEKNSETFITFLEYVLVEKNPTGRFILVLDRASYHKNAAALTALSLFEHRIMIIWLPAYCTELNPIERFWRYLKDLTCANQLRSSLEEVIAKVEQVLHQQNAPDYEYRFELSKSL
jgi:transposase